MSSRTHSSYPCVAAIIKGDSPFFCFGTFKDDFFWINFKIYSFCNSILLFMLCSSLNTQNVDMFDMFVVFVTLSFYS
ncbi:hypothetical protein NY2A_b025R [Paramecium bursaria Chlorella virus NY2A]|uniref:Uncharacterized protein b025R n=1 Tax=Paramecium bursaria Chlorella virus NY2A TaxID=46021 RepID=A7IVQ0_PBCVN|nr:hypothetical protein NY2A_b025R [Paramecium bursaria Chlorella virus NY2A]ABT14424.1 hypothetical protein NY2A_b025R [Paramecium bursaria Chlorella virus NY2A]